LKCCQFEVQTTGLQQRQLAAECNVFGDNSATEYYGISQIAPWNLAKFATEKRWR